MRIMSVIGALALACLCLASPSIAASPADHLTFDAVSHELRAVQPTPSDFAAVVDVFGITAPMITAAAAPPDALDLPSPGAADKAACDVPDVMYGGPPDGSMTSQLLPACTDLRRYDPGWRSA